MITQHPTANSRSTVDPAPAMPAAAGPSIVPAVDPKLPSLTAGPSSDHGFRHVFCPKGYVAQESPSSESIQEARRLLQLLRMLHQFQILMKMLSRSP